MFHRSSTSFLNECLLTRSSYILMVLFGRNIAFFLDPRTSRFSRSFNFFYAFIFIIANCIQLSSYCTCKSFSSIKFSRTTSLTTSTSFWSWRPIIFIRFLLKLFLWFLVIHLLRLNFLGKFFWVFSFWIWRTWIWATIFIIITWITWARTRNLLDRFLYFRLIPGLISNCSIIF